MKISQWTEEKEGRKILIRIKGMDCSFSFNVKNEKLFYITSEYEIFGYAVLKLDKEAELKRIFIRNKLRNNGYGTILLKYLINWLIDNDFDSLVVTDHKNMNNFLEKQRFIKNDTGYELKNLTEIKKEKNRMLFVSKFAIVINILLAFLKIISGNVFKSLALLSDGLNSLSDLITNILVIIGLKVGGSPEDEDHPFGHGKIESVFSIIIGTFIILTAFDIIKENAGDLFNRNENQKTISPAPLVITIIVILIKIFQLIFMKIKTKDSRGALIETLIEDYKADIVISASVLSGLLLSTINPVFDVVVGLSVAAYIIYTGYKLIRENALILLDSQNEELLEEVKDDIFSFDEIENAHDFRMTTSGKDVYIFVDVRMDKNITIDKAHEISSKISNFIKHRHKNIKRVLIHIEPMYDIK